MNLLLEHSVQSHPAEIRPLSSWVAVLGAAAALGLWRIRVSASSKTCPAAPSASFSQSPTPPPELVAPATAPRPYVPQTVPADQKCRAEPSTQSSVVVGEGDLTAKNRFAAYYESSYAEDDYAADCDENDVGSVDYVEVDGACCVVGATAPRVRHWAFSEDVAMARKGDLGWYRFQDREVFNGTVVRLWKGRRSGGGFAARRRKTAC